MNRPPSHREQEVLAYLLSVDSPGRDELRLQAPTLRVIGRCGCGCATITVEADRSASPPDPVGDMSPVGASTKRHRWQVRLLVYEGYLSEIEIYAATGEPPPEFPAPSELDPPHMFPHRQGRH